MNQSKARDFGRGGGVRDITPILEMPEETEAGAWSDYLTSNRAAAVLVWLLAVVCTYELTRRLLAGVLGLLLAGIVPCAVPVVAEDATRLALEAKIREG